MDLHEEKILTYIMLRYMWEQEAVLVEKADMALKLEVVAFQQEIQASCIRKEVTTLDQWVAHLE
jgi:hypothetical protein